MMRSPEVYTIPYSFGSVLEMHKSKLDGMTDIDFRRFASLLFALQLNGVIEQPIVVAVELADKLLEELQKKE
jgi:hypothetical protein